MQTVNKVCLALTGVCVVILIFGIGIGIGRRANCTLIDSNDISEESNDTSTEYDAYDDDYVDIGEINDAMIHDARVFDFPTFEQETREMAL